MEEKSEHIIRREHFVAGVETGIDSERARIIALLEATEELRTIEAGWLVNYADIAIALIKGENK